jgi:hypothetical protein
MPVLTEWCMGFRAFSLEQNHPNVLENAFGLRWVVQYLKLRRVKLRA